MRAELILVDGSTVRYIEAVKGTLYTNTKLCGVPSEREQTCDVFIMASSGVILKLEKFICFQTYKKNKHM